MDGRKQWGAILFGHGGEVQILLLVPMPFTIIDFLEMALLLDT